HRSPRFVDRVVDNLDRGQARQGPVDEVWLREHHQLTEGSDCFKIQAPLAADSQGKIRCAPCPPRGVQRDMRGARSRSFQIRVDAKDGEAGGSLRPERIEWRSIRGGSLHSTAKVDINVMVSKSH